MTEDEARASLRAFATVGVEQWLAEQPWEPAPDGGWKMLADLHGWGFRLEPVSGGVHVTMFTGEGELAAWVVPAA